MPLSTVDNVLLRPTNLTHCVGLDSYSTGGVVREKSELLRFAMASRELSNFLTVWLRQHLA